MSVFNKQGPITLPSPDITGSVPLETAISHRRSKRHFGGTNLSLHELSQVLWAAQGITSKQGYRAAPSAGALYPLEIMVVISHMDNLTSGVYNYRPGNHELIMRRQGNIQNPLCQAALGQSSVRKAPAVLAICAVYERTMKKYGRRGIRYVHMEAGHAAENVYLQAVALQAKTLAIGAFSDSKVEKLLNLDPSEKPLYLMPIGK